MDPYHYLHLPDCDLDIRGSKIALFFQHNLTLLSTTTIYLNFQDGRWGDVIKEPEMRLKESLSNVDMATVSRDPFFVHLVFLSSVLRWWSNVLTSFDDQLINYVSSCRCYPVSDMYL
jgi:hypothetical protein